MNKIYIFENSLPIRLDENQCDMVKIILEEIFNSNLSMIYEKSEIKKVNIHLKDSKVIFNTGSLLIQLEIDGKESDDTIQIFESKLRFLKNKDEKEEGLSYMNTQISQYSSIRTWNIPIRDVENNIFTQISFWYNFNKLEYKKWNNLITI